MKQLQTRDNITRQILLKIFIELFENNVITLFSPESPSHIYGMTAPDFTRRLAAGRWSGMFGGHDFKTGPRQVETSAHLRGRTCLAITNKHIRRQNPNCTHALHKA